MQSRANRRDHVHGMDKEREGVETKPTTRRDGEFGGEGEKQEAEEGEGETAWYLREDGGRSSNRIDGRAREAAERESGRMDSAP